jgi:hypothetical protein
MVSARFGDRLGSAIYDANPAKGFLYCVVATTMVYALILPILFLIPKPIVATADGEAAPVVDAPV